MDYTIKAGDNLTNIAKANNTDVATLAKLNNLSNVNLIKTGSTLKLPGQQTQTTTPLVTTPPTDVNVPATNIGNVNPINVPPAPINTTPTLQLGIADKAISDIIATQDTASQTAQKELINKKLLAELGLIGETQAKADELAKVGYQQKLQEYQNLNSQILQKQAEIKQDDVKLVADMRAQENRDTLLPFAQMGQQKLAGDAAIVRALKNSEIGVLNAQVLAKQGDIELARQTAQDAVDLKYAPYKEQIKQYDAMLETIQPLLTADEKKQSAVQQIKSQVAMKQIDALSNFQKDALANAISNNAPQSVLNKIQSATSIADITSSVGSNYLLSKADKLDMQLKNLQIAKASQELGGNGIKPPTDTQVTNAGYATRIAQANQVIDSNTDTFKNMGYAKYKLIESNSPLANSLLSPAEQQAAQAMRSFITAKLRKESGAAISPTEFADARTTYFPQYGDSQEVISQKKATRDAVLQNNIQGAGSAYKPDILSSYLDSVTQVTSSGSAVSDYINSLPKKSLPEK